MKKKPRFAAFFFAGRTARSGRSPLRRSPRRSRCGWAGDAHRDRHSAWCATSNVVEVGFDDEPEAFSNINTREELHTWENAPPAW